MTWRVRVACRNDATGASYQPGDVVTAADFPKAVIAAWLADDPPVLEVIENGS